MTFQPKRVDMTCHVLWQYPFEAAIESLHGKGLTIEAAQGTLIRRGNGANASRLGVFAVGHELMIGLISGWARALKA